MQSDAAGKMKRIEIIDQKVLGQKDMFARYFQEYRGKWPVAPVGLAPMPFTFPKQCGCLTGCDGFCC